RGVHKPAGSKSHRRGVEEGLQRAPSAQLTRLQGPGGVRGRLWKCRPDGQLGGNKTAVSPHLPTGLDQRGKQPPRCSHSHSPDDGEVGRIRSKDSQTPWYRKRGHSSSSRIRLWISSP